MKCGICGDPIILRPSAAERAAKVGGQPADYSSLFTTHVECELRERHRPLPRRSVAELPVIFQELEMLRLRQLVTKTFGTEAGSRTTADYVNNLSEAALLELL